MTTQQDYGGDIAEVVEKIREQELAQEQAAQASGTDPGTATSERQTATGTTESTQASTAEGSTEGTGTTEGQSSTAAEATAAAPAPAEQHGDVRGALRASRRAERAARAEADRLKAELEETRKQIPAPKDETVTDAELAELEQDMPIVAKALKETRALKAQLPAAPAPAQQAQPEFAPVVQPDAVQEAIDEIPALLEMQNDPDQSRFNLAVQTDALLRQHPKWADKPMAERLAECARRVNAELGDASAAAPAAAPQPPARAPAPATQRRDPAAVAAAAPRAPVSTLSDIAGGAAPTTEAPGLKQFMNMSNEDIMAALERHGG